MAGSVPTVDVPSEDLPSLRFQPDLARASLGACECQAGFSNAR